jgi:hypothetical protein
MKKVEELQAKTEELVKLKQWRPVLIKIQAELQKLLDLLPRRRNMTQHAQYDELTKALKLVNVGFTYERGTKGATEGIPFAIMTPMEHRPGLEETDARIKILTDECRELRAYCKRWPTPDTKNKFKYIGKPNKHAQDGKYLEPGDEVLLSESAALSLADRFEAIST